MKRVFIVNRIICRLLQVQIHDIRCAYGSTESEKCSRATDCRSRLRDQHNLAHHAREKKLSEKHHRGDNRHIRAYASLISSRIFILSGFRQLELENFTK